MGASLDALIPELADAARALVDVGDRAGVQPRITSTLRSNSEQARLYRRFLAGASQYPVAPPGRSAHEYGFAFDLVVYGPDNQADLGSVWQSWGGVWHPSDAIHFEYPGFKQHLASREGFEPPTIERTPRGPTPLVVQAADLIVGMIPFVGGVELVAYLVSLGFPEGDAKAALEMASSPLETIYQSRR